MKLTCSNFKGMVPRLTPRMLPDGYGATVQNGRVLSGDLTAWNIPSALGPLSAPGTINSLYRMQTQNAGADVFLRSVNDVNWARGIISGDVNETILFTGFPDNPSTGGSLSSGTAQPKITNFTLATSGTPHTGQTAGNYPNDWRLLGSPTPGIAPTITQTVSSSNVLSTVNDGSSLTGWTTLTATAGDSVTIDSAIGNSAPSIRLTQTGNSQISPTVGLYKDFQANLNTVLQVNADFRYDNANINLQGLLRLVFLSNSNGQSYAVTITFGGGTNQFYTWTISRFDNNSFATPSLYGTILAQGTSTSFFQTNTWYTIKLNLFRSPVTQTNSSPLNIGLQIVVGGNTQISSNITVTDKNYGGILGFTFQAVSGNVSNFLNMDNFSVFQSTSSVDTSAAVSNYIYTWVNQFGQESAPSPVNQNNIFEHPNLTTVISTIADPTTTQQTNYGLINPPSTPAFGIKNLYRAATASNGQTQYLFVAAIPYGITTYNDTLTDSQLGSALRTSIWGLPPSDGFNVMSLPNGITFMASKNNVYPSVQNQPHAYPLNYVLTTDFPIVGMSHIDNLVVVLTQSYPYLVSGSDPSTLAMTKLDIPYGCIAKRSIATLKGYGVIYATANGLVAINGAGGVNLISMDFFTREQWQALSPANIIGWVHDDRYFFYSGTTAYLFDPKQGGLGLIKLDISQASPFTNDITAAYADPITDKLYEIYGGTSLATWNTGASKLPYDYTSRILFSPYPTNFHYAQLRGPGVVNTTFGLIGDGTQFYTTTRTGQGEFVVPVPSQSVREWQLRLVGSDTVELAEIGDTMEEFE